MRTVIAAAAALGAAMAGGCNPACTLADGIDGLRLDVTTTGALPPGPYTLVVRGDGNELRCLLGGPGATTPPPCPITTTIAGESWTLDASLSSSGGHIQVGILGAGGPAFVEVRLFRDTDLLGAQDYRPEYEPHYPNGPDCPPEVLTATDTFVVVAPSP
jgi:hypothetical protein